MVTLMASRRAAAMYRVGRGGGCGGVRVAWAGAAGRCDALQRGSSTTARCVNRDRVTRKTMAGRTRQCVLLVNEGMQDAGQADRRRGSLVAYRALSGGDSGRNEGARRWCGLLGGDKDVRGGDRARMVVVSIGRCTMEGCEGDATEVVRAMQKMDGQRERERDRTEKWPPPQSLLRETAVTCVVVGRPPPPLQPGPGRQPTLRSPGPLSRQPTAADCLKWG